MRMAWPDARFRTASSHSTHGLDLPGALELAERLNRLPPSVSFFGVEVEKSARHDGLGVAVRAALPDLRRRILEELYGSPKQDGTEDADGRS